MPDPDHATRAVARVYQIERVATDPPPRSARSRQYKHTNPVEPGTLGAAIREGRLKKGWTQTDLGVEAGVAQAQISAFERGVIKRPDPETLLRLDVALGLAPNTLLSMAGWKGARHVTDLIPSPGAIVLEDPSPEMEHLIDIVAQLEVETVRRIAEIASQEYRATVQSDDAENEAEEA